MTYKHIYVSAFVIAMALPVVLVSSASAAGPPQKTALRAIGMSAPKPKTPPVAREMLYATGEGAMANAKEQPNRAKAYLEAKAYAKMQAIASVVQIAKGTLIEYTSRGEHYSADTLIKEEIKGVVDSVQVVGVSKRSVEKDIIVAVTVRAPKPIPPKVPPITPTTPKAPAVFQPSWVADSCSSSRQPRACDGFTSVIIDAQGLGVCRSMSPRILRPDGSEVWGTVKSDYDFISEYGIVAYANSRADACTSKRAGDRPLIVRALSQGNSAFQSDVVISASDAQAVEEANRKTKFLEDYRVIIVVDRAASIAAFRGKQKQ